MNRDKSISASSLESDGGAPSVQPTSGLVTCQVNANDRLFLFNGAHGVLSKAAVSFSWIFFFLLSESDLTIRVFFFFKKQKGFSKQAVKL